MIFWRIFRKKTPHLSFSLDLPEEERARLLSELKDCANRKGGSLKNARRAEALTNLFHSLSPVGKRIFASLVAGLNDDAGQSTGEQYSEIEEAELFGGSESKLAVLDMFETPRRRLLAHLDTTSNGKDFLNTIGAIVPEEVCQDIRDLQAAAK
ncbi:MAG: hypothetical protein CFH41_00671 [Alphaproteobacteria bacterium MarineAlpha11_Bin1]|nr:MAG: hypothetical protein CFH41_00671 [Alphaproteobacteria bacterium MarineAlpha11_Bin1]|tara:strand:+ start:11503 stop:11961 length:459 start_codon:yes stop_codon:yes gene_type:complete